MCLLSLSFNYMFIFKVLTVVCGTLHHLIPLPPSVTRSHTGLFALPGPWGVHLPPQALLCRATLWLHLGLGSSISSSNIYYNHLMSIYSSTLWNLLLSSLPPPSFYLSSLLSAFLYSIYSLSLSFITYYLFPSGR